MLFSYTFSLYNAQWHDAQVDLSYILEVERPKVPEKPQKVSVCIGHTPPASVIDQTLHLVTAANIFVWDKQVHMSQEQHQQILSGQVAWCEYE